MQKLPLRKVLTIIKLYLNGWSYSEIAARVGVSKSTVGNVIAAFKAGRFPEAGSVPEQVELLHEVAVDLRQKGATPGQAVVGIATLSRFHELGLEPVDLERLADLCRALPQEAMHQPNEYVEINEMVKAAKVYAIMAIKLLS